MYSIEQTIELPGSGEYTLLFQAAPHVQDTDVNLDFLIDGNVVKNFVKSGDFNYFPPE